jgi:hypothetical protein
MHGIDVSLVFVVTRTGYGDQEGCMTLRMVQCI